MSFDLKHLVDEVLAESLGVRQTGDLADKVLDQVPRSEMRAALRETLPMYIRSRIALSRNLPTPEPSADPYVDTKPRQASVRNSARSQAMKAIREWWLDRVEVHVSGGGYLKLGECTFEDLMFAVEERRTRALDMVKAADRFEIVAKAVKDAGVATVADLPPKVRTDLSPLFDRT